MIFVHAGIAVAAQLRPFVHAAAFALLLGLGSLADGQTRADCERRYAPQSGQPGKDVIWVPTEDTMVVRMLELAGVTPADKLYDLGAGDGKIAIAAGKRFGATAVGVEYDRELVRYAQCLVEVEGLEARVRVVRGDIFATDFSDATVVALYLLPELNIRLRPTLLDMQPGTRVVSYSFAMGDWTADEHVETAQGVAYLWVVPAKVGGTWTFRSRVDDERFDVTFDRTFQNLEGSTDGAAVTGRLRGSQIDFAFTHGDEPTRFTGTVDGDRIDGTVTRGRISADYVATPTQPGRSEQTD